MRWIRIIVFAVLYEVALIAITIPFALYIAMESLVVFVPPVLFVVGLPFGLWTVRKVKSGFVLHGALVGVVATLIYLGLILGQYGSLTPVIELYGPFLFFLANAMKVVGCSAGAYAGGRLQKPA
jgi:hypothetical protein